MRYDVLQKYLCPAESFCLKGVRLGRLEALDRAERGEWAHRFANSNRDLGAIIMQVYRGHPPSPERRAGIFHHTIFHTQLCHTHHLSPHHLSHTTLSHTITHHLSPHHLSHTTLSHTIFHTQLCHTLSFTQLSHTHTPSFTHTQLCHTPSFLCHAPSFTYNFVTHLVDPSALPLSFLPSPSCYNICCSLLEEVDLWGYPVLQFFVFQPGFVAFVAFVASLAFVGVWLLWLPRFIYLSI